MRYRDSWLAMAVAVFVAACPSTVDAALRYDPARPLITLHGPVSQNSLSDLDQVLDKLASDDAPSGKLPILLYVHGRGNEPKKSFGDTMFTSGFVLRKLEQQGVRVLGFNWWSKIGFGQLCDRPVAEAKKGASDFTLLLRKLDEHRRDHAEYWKNRRLVLLAHSMGNILVAQALSDRTAAQIASSMFDDIVLSAADAPLSGHVLWQNQIQPGKTYVLSNPNDRFLVRSMRCEGKQAEQRLGLTQVKDGTMSRSLGTTYIEVPAGNRHRYISRGAQEGNPYVCSTIGQLLRGDRPTFPSSWVVGADPIRIRIPANVDRDDRCFYGQGKDDKESEKES